MSYNEELQSNNNELAEILQTVNALPNAGGGSGGGGYDMEQLVLHTITDDEAASAAYLSFDLPKNFREYMILLYATPCTNAINGKIAFNATKSPWSTGTGVSYNISAYTTGYRNTTIRFAVDDAGILIPIAGYQSFNEAASSNRGSTNPNYLPMMLTKTPNIAPELYELPKNRTRISFGSYAVGYLGAGSIFAVYGIGGYDFVEDDA